MPRKLLVPVVLAPGTCTHVRTGHHCMTSTNSFERLVTSSWGRGTARQGPGAPCHHCHLQPALPREDM